MQPVKACSRARGQPGRDGAGQADGSAGDTALNPSEGGPDRSKFWGVSAGVRLGQLARRRAQRDDASAGQRRMIFTRRPVCNSASANLTFGIPSSDHPQTRLASYVASGAKPPRVRYHMDAALHPGSRTTRLGRPRGAAATANADRPQPAPRRRPWPRSMPVRIAHCPFEGTSHGLLHAAQQVYCSMGIPNWDCTVPAALRRSMLSDRRPWSRRPGQALTDATGQRSTRSPAANSHDLEQLAPRVRTEPR